MSKIPILASIFGILACAVGINVAAQTAPQAWGDSVNGLQVSIFQDPTFQTTDAQMHLTVEFRNVGHDDETFTTGGGGCGFQRDATANVLLNLTDSQGTQHRHLPFFGDGPPYKGGFCAGVPFPATVVTLHPGESVSMPLFVERYLDLSDSKVYKMQRFPAGTYSLTAELARPFASNTPPRFTSTMWSGTVLSNVLSVHFDAEFAAVFDDCEAEGLHCHFRPKQ